MSAPVSFEKLMDLLDSPAMAATLSAETLGFLKMMLGGPAGWPSAGFTVTVRPTGRPKGREFGYRTCEGCAVVFIAESVTLDADKGYEWTECPGCGAHVVYEAWASP